MLNVKTVPRRVVISFTLQEENIALLKELAAAYDMPASRVVEAMISQYGPKILADRLEKSGKTVKTPAEDADV